MGPPPLSSSALVTYFYWSRSVTVTEALVLRPLLEDRGRIRIPYPNAHRQNETEMFSDHDETSPSIAVVSASSVACSMLAVQQQKRLCRQFVDMFAALCHNIEIIVRNN